MCQALPGLRCSAHAKREVSKLNRSLNDMHSHANVSSPAEVLTLQRKEEKIRRRLDTALKEWAMTPAGQKELREHGERQYADEVKDIRDRRKDATQRLEDLVSPYQSGEIELPSYPEYETKTQDALELEKEMLAKRERALRKNLTRQIDSNEVDSSLLNSIAIVKTRQLAVEQKLNSVGSQPVSVPQEEGVTIVTNAHFDIGENGEVTNIYDLHGLFNEVMGHEPSFGEFEAASDAGFYNPERWSVREDGFYELDYVTDYAMHQAVEDMNSNPF